MKAIVAPWRGYYTLYILATCTIATALVIPGCGSREPGKEKGSAGAVQHYRLGAEKYRRGDFIAAVNIYEKALQLDPDLAEAHLDLGIICDDYLRDKARAVSHYREYLRLEPKSEKAEMVGRWIARAEEEGARPAAGAGEPGTPVPAAASAPEETAAQLELGRVRDDMISMKAENEAYLKTIAALREELTQAKQKIEKLFTDETQLTSAEKGTEKGGATGAGDKLASIVRSLETEKTQLWERYRNEKGDLEKTVQLLKGEVARMQAQKKASDEALQKANTRLDELRKVSSGDKDFRAAAVASQHDLSTANERIAELERNNALYLKDNRALLARLIDAEKELKAQRAKPPAQSTQNVPHLIAKARADAEREKDELRNAYEKKLVEVKDAFAREKNALQKEAAPVSAAALAKARADAEREKEDLRQSYERKLAETKRGYEAEKGELQKELSGAQRGSQYLRAQLDRSKDDAGRAGQAQAVAIQRLKEQHQREKAELERRYRREREILLSRLDTARAKAAPPASVPVPAAPQSGAAQGTAAGQRQVSATRARRYRVAAGDSLRTLAVRFYGDAGRWRTIYDANRDKLTSPTALAPGQILSIP
jgi:nucleoid-associated protein YgaU